MRANLAFTDRKGVAISLVSLAFYAAVIGLAATVPVKRSLILFLQIFASTLGTWLLMGLLILGVLLAREMVRGPAARPHEFVARIVSERWAKDRLFWFWWPVLLYSLLLTLFALFKQLVLPLAPFQFDAAFHAADRAIFGLDPWILSHGRPWLTEAFGHLYYGWYAPMLFGTLACSFVVNRPEFRQRYLTAFVFTWLIVGSLMAFLLPAAGPCYWDEFVGEPNPYAPLMESLRADVALSSFNPVLDIQAYLLKSHGGGALSVGGGISAMPSMHVALATIFACGAWTIHRGLGVLFALFAVAIWWASIHLGWHYAVDGLVAAPAALLIWFATGRLFKSPAENPLSRQPTAALAIEAAE